ncbi:arginine deiminase family protein [Enterococcus faecalis]
MLGIENNKSVNEAMEAEGIKVIKLPLEQILKAGGGPHCMTYPVRRA